MCLPGLVRSLTKIIIKVSQKNGHFSFENQYLKKSNHQWNRDTHTVPLVVKLSYDIDFQRRYEYFFRDPSIIIFVTSGTQTTGVHRSHLVVPGACTSMAVSLVVVMSMLAASSDYSRSDTVNYHRIIFK